MMTPRDLLQIPITYDIVVSDFGRDATIEYLRLAAEAEKRLIESVLRPERRDFFDEYRRMMFTVIADVSFFKRTAIAESAAGGYLTDTILLGVGFTPVSADVVARVAVAVAQAALAALDRGHERLRIAMPCNGLSVLAAEVGRLIRSNVELRNLMEGYEHAASAYGRISSARLDVHTVPDAVMRHLFLNKKHGLPTQLLVLGTRGANATYASIADCHSVEVLPLSDEEYGLINRSIVASIGGDKKTVGLYRDQLNERVIEPRRRTCADLVVLEACTDFKFGLGHSSLKVFAEAMVMDCYRADGFASTAEPSRV